MIAVKWKRQPGFRRVTRARVRLLSWIPAVPSSPDEVCRRVTNTIKFPPRTSHSPLSYISYCPVYNSISMTSQSFFDHGPMCRSIQVNKIICLTHPQPNKWKIVHTTVRKWKTRQPAHGRPSSTHQESLSHIRLSHRMVQRSPLNSLATPKKKNRIAQGLSLEGSLLCLPDQLSLEYV